MPRVTILAALLATAGHAAPADDAALVRAIRANDVAAVEAALRHHADPNARGAFGASPLTLAVETQSPATVAALLAAHAMPNTADADGMTPLDLACEHGDPAIVAALLDAPADVRVALPDGTTPLAICARFGPADAVARMLVAGAMADAVDTRGQTPLMWAAAGGRVEAIALLLKAGADVDRVSQGGFTPLFFAIKSGAVAPVDALLAAGADAAYRGPEHTSALQLALYQRNYAAALRFVAHADLAERDRQGLTPLHVAAAAGDGPLIAALLTHGADANALTGASRITWVTEANFGIAPRPVPPTPPLFLAAAGGHAEAMARLLAAGADPHFVAADGTNLVLAAAHGTDAAALDLALQLAPDANVADRQGTTALHLLAGGAPFPDLAAMLLALAAHGARTDLKTTRGMTAAALAVDGRTEVKALFFAAFPHAATTVPLPAAGARAKIARSP